MFTTSNGLRPVHQIFIATTNKTQQELNIFLQSINHRFTQATYDLINNNCNNFSDEVTRFLTSQGIPSYIIDLPRIVFSTPGGAMLRPLIEGMQNGINQHSNSGNNFDPFANMGASSSVTSPFPTNPNANIGNITQTSYVKGNAISHTSTHVEAINQTITTAKASASNKDIPLHETPLVSNDRDSTTLSNIMNKITTYITNNILTDNTLLEVYNNKQITLTAIENAVSQLIANTLQQFPNEAFMSLYHISDLYPKLTMSCYFIMRLLVLVQKDMNPEIVYPIIIHIVEKLKQPEVGFNNSHASMVMALCTLANILSHSYGCQIIFIYVSSDSAITMNTEELFNNLIDICMWGLCHEKAEIRQISGALAYNISLACTSWHNGDVLEWKSLHLSGGYREPFSVAMSDATKILQLEQDNKDLAFDTSSVNNIKESNIVDNMQVVNEPSDVLHPHVVQLLCGTLENLNDEKDVVSLRRKILTAYRICRAGGGPAKELAIGLGFDSVICEIHSANNKNLNEEDKNLVSKLSSILS